MRKLLQLLNQNRAVAGRQCEIVETDSEATVYLYDSIVSDSLEAEWWGGVAAQDFVPSLKAITAPVIHLRINSPGGDVFAAQAIAQAIKDHPSRVVAHIDGLAASAASFIAISADEVEIASGGFFMIHKAWTIAIGNENDLLDQAAVLAKVDSVLADQYASATGGDVDQIKEMMASETWLTAQESVDQGFADRIAEGSTKAKAAWNLAAYAKAPVIEQEEPPKQTPKHQSTPASNDANARHEAARRKLAAL